MSSGGGIQGSYSIQGIPPVTATLSVPYRSSFKFLHCANKHRDYVEVLTPGVRDKIKVCLKHVAQGPLDQDSTPPNRLDDSALNLIISGLCAHVCLNTKAYNGGLSNSNDF